MSSKIMNLKKLPEPPEKVRNIKKIAKKITQCDSGKFEGKF